MKILLDECIDRRFAKELKNYAVHTVPQMGWAGIKNGKLLSLAEQKFDVFITVDRNLAHQQNLTKFDITILILYAQTNRLKDLKPLAPKILRILPQIKTRQIIPIKT